MDDHDRNAAVFCGAVRDEREIGDVVGARREQDPPAEVVERERIGTPDTGRVAQDVRDDAEATPCHGAELLSRPRERARVGDDRRPLARGSRFGRLPHERRRLGHHLELDGGAERVVGGRFERRDVRDDAGRRPPFGDPDGAEDARRADGGVLAGTVHDADFSASASSSATSSAPK